MDLTAFKLDIDDLINEFAEGEATTLAEMKRIWLSKKFSFIFEASPSTNQACFMQSLFAHSIGYLISTSSLSHRLGGLYCLYCLFETQPFKPPIKIYLSLGELKRLRNLILEAKMKDVKLVSGLVKRMLDRNMFLFGFIDINEGSVTERVNELMDLQNAWIQVAYKKLFPDTRIVDFIQMDLGKDLDGDLIKKGSSDYAAAKELAIKEADGVVDVQDIKHIAENKQLIGDVVEKIAMDWNVEKDLFYQQTGFLHPPTQDRLQQEENGHSKRQKCSEDLVQKELEQYENVKDQEEEDFGKELEEALLSLPFEYRDQETEYYK